MITLNSVVKRYKDGHEALRGISLDIEDGEMIWLTGHSGAGKSTLLHLMSGLQRPTSGSLKIHEQDISRLNSRALARLRSKIGLVLQGRRLLMNRSVRENAALPLQIAGLYGDEIWQRVEVALDKVGLGTHANMSPMALSGGEQQRLCIARAIVNRPRLLIADEPTANLDRSYAKTILDILSSFHRSGVTVVIAMPDSASDRLPSARFLRLEDGMIGTDSEAESAEVR